MVRRIGKTRRVKKNGAPCDALRIEGESKELTLSFWRARRDLNPVADQREELPLLLPVE